MATTCDFELPTSADDVTDWRQRLNSSRHFILSELGFIVGGFKYLLGAPGPARPINVLLDLKIV